jgi:hypothetical protein
MILNQNTEKNNMSKKMILNLEIVFDIPEIDNPEKFCLLAFEKNPENFINLLLKEGYVKKLDFTPTLIGHYNFDCKLHSGSLNDALCSKYGVLCGSSFCKHFSHIK